MVANPDSTTDTGSPALDAWFEALEGAIDDASEIPDCPLDDLSYWLREGGDLPEIPSLRLLDEIQALKAIRLKPLERIEEALSNARSILDAAEIDEVIGAFAGTLRAILGPVFNLSTALGAIEGSITVGRGARALLIAPPRQLTSDETKEVGRALRSSGVHGADGGTFEVLVFPQGTEFLVLHDGDPVPAVVLSGGDWTPETEAEVREQVGEFPGILNLPEGVVVSTSSAFDETFSEGPDRERFEDPEGPPVGFTES